MLVPGEPREPSLGFPWSPLALMTGPLWDFLGSHLGPNRPPELSFWMCLGKPAKPSLGLPWSLLEAPELCFGCVSKSCVLPTLLLIRARFSWPGWLSICGETLLPEHYDAHLREVHFNH